MHARQRFVLLIFIAVSLVLVARQKTPITQTKLEALAASCGGGDRQCWDRLFRSTLADYGVDGALTMLAYAYDTTAAVGEDTCHDLTHFLGREAYKLFARGRQFPVTAKTAYCNYGFFHGVMESMQKLKKPTSDAHKFCRYIDQAISKEAPEAIFQCFHGIGHGLANNHDPRTWGDEEAMLAPALKICDDISHTREERWRCGSGAFHGLGTFYLKNLYNLKVDLVDPFWICNKQIRDEYAETCYRELSAVLGMVISDGDFLKMARVIDTIKDDHYATETMIAWWVPYKESIAYRPIGIDFCRLVPARLETACIKSIARQMIQAGTPGDELAQAATFCAGYALTQAEQTSCFDFVLYWNSRWYSKEKSAHFCDTIFSSKRVDCYKKIQETSSKPSS